MIHRWKKKLARLAAGVLVFAELFTFPAFARPDWPSDTGIEAEAGAVMDVDTGTLIFGQNSHVEYYPASITKILTALIVLEHADLSDTVTYSETAMNAVEADSGNKLSLVAGDTMTVEDCLYALLLASVNQAANALAEHVAGSIPAFVDMMNEKLTELGCSESHFANPSGLNNDDQVVTAYDMTKIAAAAYSNSKLLEISSAKSKKLGATTNNPDGVSVSNEHRLVITEDTDSPYYCPEALAGKTGYLLKAGNTLVTYGEKDGRRVVSVILKGSPRQYFIDGKALLQFALDRFKNVVVAEEETRYVTGEDSVEVNGATYSPSELAIQPGAKITLPTDSAFSDADVSLGAAPDGAPEGTVGLLTYTYNERRVGTAYLMTKQGAEALAAGDTGTIAESAAESTEAVESQESSEETESTDETQAQMEDTEIPAETEQEEAAKASLISKLPVGVIIAGLVILLLAAVIGGGIYLTIQNRKREAEAEALRREKRRKRLMEEGGDTEAEFNRLMEEKRKRAEERRKNR